MAENEAPQGATGATTGESHGDGGTDWKAEARKWEARAKESFAAAKANEDAAKRLAEIEESQKSETQKLQERISGLEAELAAAQTDATRSQIQARYGISEEDAALFLTATDSDGLEAQAKALAERINKQMKNGPVVLADRGKPSEGGSDAMRELAQRVFKN